MHTSKSNAEQIIRLAFEAGELEQTASAIIQAYGTQIFSFVASRLRSQTDAQAAYAMFAEDLWLGLPSFSWRCSARTWSYTIARNAMLRVVGTTQRRAVHVVSRSYPRKISELVVRSFRAPDYQRTDIKSQFRSLRERLEPEDQMLLVLRVDRSFTWRDLARAMSGDVELDESSIARESARLRKAFKRLTLQLKGLALEARLLSEDS